MQLQSHQHVHKIEVLWYFHINKSTPLFKKDQIPTCNRFLIPTFLKLTYQWMLQYRLQNCKNSSNKHLLFVYSRIPKRTISIRNKSCIGYAYFIYVLSGCYSAKLNKCKQLLSLIIQFNAFHSSASKLYDKSIPICILSAIKIKLQWMNTLPKLLKNIMHIACVKRCLHVDSTLYSFPAYLQMH